MKVVYIAGPFRASTAWGIAQNVREAERWALEVAKCGAMPLCPHTNTANFHGMLTEEFWIEGTLELLKRCDAALFIPNWMESAGARAEHVYCETNNLPMFGPAHVPGALRHWVQTASP